MQNINFIYRTSGGDLSRTIRVKRLRGLTEPDEIQHNSPPIHIHLDGHLEKEICGGKKSVEIIVPALASEMDKRFVAAFILATKKSVVYTGPSSVYTSEVVNRDARLVAQWMHAVEHGRSFDLLLDDVRVFRGWDDGITTMTIVFYTSSKVIEFTGKMGTVQTFITNTSPLDLDVWNKVFPAFDPAIHKATIVGIPMAYSSFTYSQVGEATISGGNITWQAIGTDAGTPDDAGKYWIKFYITVQTTT